MLLLLRALRPSAAVAMCNTWGLLPAIADATQQQWAPRSVCMSQGSLHCKPSLDARAHSSWHGTTILCVRRGQEVVLVGDGQATQGDYIVKHTVRKVRRLGSDRHPALAGFAGVAVDGLALLERLEGKLTEHPGQLLRAAVELAKMWRQDKLLRELDASLIVADAVTTLWLMGNGDVLEAGSDGVMAIGSGADFADSAARALLQLQDSSSEEVAGADAADLPCLLQTALASMRIAADCCIYTNDRFAYQHLRPDGSIASGDAWGGAAPSAAAAAAAAAETSGGGGSAQGECGV